MCRDRDRFLLLSGWTRLCLNAASNKAVKGGSAAETARGKPVENEATVAADTANVLQRAAATNGTAAAVATTTEQRRQGAVDVSTLAAEVRRKAENTERKVREQQERRVKMLVSGLRLSVNACYSITQEIHHTFHSKET